MTQIEVMDDQSDEKCARCQFEDKQKALDREVNTYLGKEVRVCIAVDDFNENIRFDVTGMLKIGDKYNYRVETEDTSFVEFSVTNVKKVLAGIIWLKGIRS